MLYQTERNAIQQQLQIFNPYQFMVKLNLHCTDIWIDSQNPI